mgnify:FL=1
MKKYIILLIIILFPLRVNATSTTLMDMDTNRVLYNSNGNDVRLIASISKIMTAIVTINNYDISNVIKIDESVLKSYGSGIYVEVGEEISVENLLYGLMLRSGNDAAIQIANTVGGSMENFVKMMNDTAKSIGMKNTNFINSSGLENDKGEGNTSTSYDMALLMSYAMKNEVFKKIVSTQKKVVKTNYKTYVWYNKNKLLKNYKFCTGGKTGFTEKARRTLVTTASKDNMNFVVVTLNDPNDFSDHLNLYEEYFKKYKSYKVLASKDKFSNEKYYIKNDKYVALTQDEFKSIKKEVVYYDNNVSDIVGYVLVKIDDKLLAKEYIYEKKETVKKKKKMSFIEKIKKLFD